MMIRITLAAMFALGLPSMAQAMSGTPEEQHACAPDVRRFCHKLKESDGDDAYLMCLENHRDSLSKPCLAVLIDHNR
jgi:hypothetical protein